MRRIAILDAPSNLGLRPPTETSVPGCAKAPGALRDHDLVARLAARDAGCLTPPRYDPGDWRPGDGVCHAEQIAAYSVALADRIGSIIDAGEFPVVLGGDCSILLGSALAMHRQGDVVGGRIGLVFVDGHSDFRHPGNASYVGAAAGEDLALATGRGQADLAGIEGRRPYYRDVDVVVLGIRAQDEYRLDLQAAGIITRPVPALRVEGAARTAQWARDQLSDCSGYWVHIDVDVLDPAVMPAVDAPDPGGIAFAELELLLSGLVDTPRCLGVEITVFDPDYDPDGSYAAEIVETVVAGLAPVRMADPSPPPAAGPSPAAEPVSSPPAAVPSPPAAVSSPGGVVSPAGAPDSSESEGPSAAGAVSLESEGRQATAGASLEGEGPQATVPKADVRAAEAVAPPARKPLPSESDAGIASAVTPAGRAAAGSGFRTTPGVGGSTVEGAAPPPMLVDSAAAEVLAAAAAAAGIRKPPAARKAPDDETSVRPPATSDAKPAPRRESKPEPAGRAKPESTDSTKTAPAGRAKPESTGRAKAESTESTKTEPAGRPKAEPESRRKAGSLRRTKDEPEPGTRDAAEPDVRLRGKAEPESDVRPRGRAEPEPDVRPRGKADLESDVRLRGRAEPESDVRPRGKAEPESGARPRKAETDSGLRRKAESAWMDVAADLAARRGTPAARRPADSGPVGLRRVDDPGPVGLRRVDDLGPGGLRRADDSGPATLRRGGAAEPAWKDDPPPPASDDDDPAAREDDEEPSGARDNGEGQAEGGVSVPAFEPFGPPAKAGPGRLRRSKKPPPAEIA